MCRVKDGDRERLSGERLRVVDACQFSSGERHFRTERRLGSGSSTAVLTRRDVDGPMISHTSTVLKRLRELSRRTSPRERAQGDYKPEFDQKARIIRLAKIETFVI